MSYISLDDVTEDYLLGKWRVKSHMVSNTYSEHRFLACKSIEFQKGKGFKAKDGRKSNKGNWEIVREKEMIYNPQVRFHLGKKITVNSIITNLETLDEKNLKLILYFDSGLELILEKEAAKNAYAKSKAA
jgi:hypothetical protein